MTVNYSRDGDVAIVAMAKPPHNLINEDLIRGIIGAYQKALEDKARAILLCSDMRHFCAGADVASFTTKQKDKRTSFEEIIAAFEDVPLPTVAAIGGAAMGGGLEFALTCDMIVAADTAQIAASESSLGLIPLLGGVQRMAQRVGPARAKELAMFGRRNDPRTLERWGLINLVVEESELRSTALSWTKQLAAGPTVALGQIKRLANASCRDGISSADKQQASANAAMWKSEDQKRGLKAFMKTGPGTGVFEGN